MKILYSELKTFIPSLKVSPKAVADCLTLTGLMVDEFQQVSVAGKKDYLIGVEVRAASRPDCLGVVGIAREVASYFGLSFVLPKYKLPVLKRMPQVSVQAAGSDVKRVAVIEVDSLNNTKPSPAWLKETVEAHGMNSVSLLVDISNYAMLMTGYPNHIFDAGKVVGGLLWQRAPKSDTLTTLDGTTLELHKGRELVISDNLGPLVLASAVGGRRSAISERTTSVLAEVAVYDPVTVRQDARQLKVSTEASNRLEKDLSPEFVVWGLEFLADALVRVGGGRVVSGVFDLYPKRSRVQVQKIVLDAGLPSVIAGITISEAESQKLLKRLGFSVKMQSGKFIVVPPSWRLDVATGPDVAEEIIRMKGFNTIPPRMPQFAPVPDVTPSRITMVRQLSGALAMLGFDEVLTLPMTTSEENTGMLWEDKSEVRIQNAINEEFPVLRQGLAAGLIGQQHEYLRKQLEHVQLFEIGKVFGKTGKRYVESERLGLLLQEQTSGRALQSLQHTVETILRAQGAVRVTYEPLGRAPAQANPHAAWVVLVAGKTVGVLYQVRVLPLSGNKRVDHTAFAEIDIELLLEQLSHERPRGAVELLQKLVVLDTNIEAGDRQDLDKRLATALRVIGRSQLWSMEVVDTYSLAVGRFRYTVRVSYRNLSDHEAKQLHEKAFGEESDSAVAVAEEDVVEVSGPAV